MLEHFGRLNSWLIISSLSKLQSLAFRYSFVMLDIRARIKAHKYSSICNASLRRRKVARSIQFLSGDARWISVNLMICNNWHYFSSHACSKLLFQIVDSSIQERATNHLRDHAFAHSSISNWPRWPIRSSCHFQIYIFLAAINSVGHWIIFSADLQLFVYGN